MTWLFVAYVLSISEIVLADRAPFFRDQEYDNGDYGGFPIEKYTTTSLVAPRANFYQYGGQCDDDGLYVMITPRGGDVEMPGPMILDGNGTLVWTNIAYRQPYNLQMQIYRGEQYLTFWAGNDAVRGHGAGMYYMLDSAYNEAYVLGAANGRDGDLHEFKITDDRTALITIFAIVPADMTVIGGPEVGWIWDAIFQEIDIETNKLLFEWKASEHISLNETYRFLGDVGHTHDGAYDWFHINSVDKDPQGNYLISSRHLHTIHYINGTSGEVMWVLGGRSNMFEDLSGGNATSFAWQHHARWHNNYTAITLFDNANEDTNPLGIPSRGLYIDLDTAAMTASVRNQYIHYQAGTDGKPSLGSTLSQGSLQILPNGNALLGYGYSAHYAEFSAAGDVLCDVHFGPASEYGQGNVQSYRVYKFPWVGKPTWPPAVHVSSNDKKIAVSWMGATEVASWSIEMADKPTTKTGTIEEDLDFVPYQTVQKSGFETSLELKDSKKRYVRVVALDLKGDVIGVSDTADTQQPREFSSAVLKKVAIIVAVGMATASLAALAFWLFSRFFKDRTVRYLKVQQPFVIGDEEEAEEKDEVDTELDVDNCHLLPKLGDDKLFPYRPPPPTFS